MRVDQLKLNIDKISVDVETVLMSISLNYNLKIAVKYNSKRNIKKLQSGNFIYVCKFFSGSISVY
jgi:hypothetical protein